MKKVGYVKTTFRRDGHRNTTNVMVVPKGHHITAHELLHDTISGRWNLEKPSMFVTLDFGTRHPQALSTYKLLEEVAFRDTLDQAEM